MVGRKLIRTTKTYVPFSNVFIAIVVILLVSNPEMSEASSDVRSSLWTYNNKKADKATGLQSLQHSLTQIQNTIDNLQNQLDPLLDKCESLNKANPAVQKTLKVLGRECDTRQKRIDELNKKIDELKAALKSNSKEGPDGNQSLEELKAELKKDKKEYEQLIKKQSELQEIINSNSNGSIPPCEELKGTSVPIMIHKNRIIPIDNPYYKYELVWHEGRKYILITKVLEGEPIQQAIEMGGLLDTILSGIDPEQQYVFFFVCPDSISAFRNAAKKVHDANIPQTWKPGFGEQIAFPADNIGQSDPEKKGPLGWQ